MADKKEEIKMADKKEIYRDDGMYEVDFGELEKIKEENLRKGKLRFGGLTKEQTEFLTRYWYFLTPRQRMEQIKKVFYGKTYSSIKKRVEIMNNTGTEFDRP